MSYYVPTEQEVIDMIDKPDIDTVKGRRDKAILELLYSSGLRKMEVYNLNIDDIDFMDNTIRVNKSKWQKDRVVPLGKKAKEGLLLYLTKSRPKWIKDTKEKALFISERGGRLSTHMVYAVVKGYSANKRVCVHSLRHACATHMLKRGADIVHLQKFLGHNSPKTTEIYTKLFPKDLLEAYRRVGLR